MTVINVCGQLTRIVYFRPESVPIAINMLDETDFRLGQRVESGPMRVKAAEASYKHQKDKPLTGEEARTRGTNAHRDRQNIIKKTQEMNKYVFNLVTFGIHADYLLICCGSRLADWDDDDPQAITEVSNRWDKVVVLKHMFTLAELASDPAAIIDIKDDVRTEGGKFGEVTNVILYDKEETGVITVRFSNTISAKACVKAFDGRIFDGQRVEASIALGSERFKKSTKQDTDEKDEKERLETFSKAIEGE